MTLSERSLLIGGLAAVVLAVVSSLLGSAIGYRRGFRSAEDQLAIPLKALTDENRELHRAFDAQTDVLDAEREYTDRMFVWYEECLDGRSCTDARQPLELRREHPKPHYPIMALPCELHRDGQTR